MSEITPASGGVCPKCGTKVPYVPENQNDLRPGTLLRERFVVGRALGHGGFGITYIAFDKHLNVLRAIKEFFPIGCGCKRDGVQNLLYPETVSAKVKSLQSRFLHEARMMSIADMNKVQNVVQIIDQFDANQTSYIIMEYLKGKTLDEYLNQFSNRIMPWKEAVSIVCSALSTLHELHKCDLIHRDISLSNIFRLNDGQIKIIDFGSSGRVSMQFKNPNELSRTSKAGYSPVEMYEYQEQGPWTDVYSMGATLFKMLVGGLPEKSKGETLPRATKAAPNRDIPTWMDDILIRATQKDPQKRYRSAAEFEQALRKHMPKPFNWRALLLSLFAITVAVSALFVINNNEKNNSDKVGPVDTIAPIVITPEPTATPLPEWTGDKEYYFNSSYIGDKDFEEFQYVLFDMAYELDMNGKFDLATQRALSRFCIDKNIDFDGTTLTSELRYAVHWYRNHDYLPKGTKELTEENRSKIDPLHELVMNISPSPNANGYIGSGVSQIEIGGTSSPNRKILLYINNATNYSYSLNANALGEWFETIPTAELKTGENTLRAVYEGYNGHDLEAEISFVYKPSMPYFQIDKLPEQNSVSLDGYIASGVQVILKVNGQNIDSVNTDDQGWFSFSGLSLMGGDLVELSGYDLADNEMTWSHVVEEIVETRPITFALTPAKNENGYIKQIDQLQVNGSASPNREILIFVNDAEEYDYRWSVDATGMWSGSINTSAKLKEGMENRIRATYADAEGYACEEIFVYKGIKANLEIDGAETIDAKTKEIKGKTEEKASVELWQNDVLVETVVSENSFLKKGFSFSNLTLNQGDILCIRVTDLAGNITEKQITVKEAARAGLTMKFSEFPYKASADCGPDGIEISGTGETGQQIVIKKGNEKLGTATVSEGVWKYQITAEQLQNGVEQIISVAYQDGKGNQCSLGVTLDSSCALVIDQSSLEEGNVWFSGVSDKEAVITLTFETETNGIKETIEKEVTSSRRDGTFRIDADVAYVGASLTLRAKDQWGNVSTSATYKVKAPELIRISIDSGINDRIGSGGVLKLSGEASAGYDVLLTIDGTDIATSCIPDQDGQWSAELTLPKKDGEYTVVVEYQRYPDNTTDAEFVFVYDRTPPTIPMLEGDVNVESKAATGLSDPDTSIVLERNGILLASGKADRDGVFELSWAQALHENDVLEFTAVDSCGNTASTTLSVKKSLPRYIGMFEDEREIDATWSGKVWLIGAEGIDGEIECCDSGGEVLERIGLKSPGVSKKEAKVKEYTGQVQTDVVLSASVNFDPVIYDAKPGMCTVTLFVYDNGEKIELVQTSFDYLTADDEANKGDGTSTLSHYDEERGFAIGLDKPAGIFNPATVVLSGYFYAPKDAKLSVMYEVDGVAYESNEKLMASQLGGKPKTKVGYRAKEKGIVADLEIVEPPDCDSAGRVWMLSMTKLEEGTHIIMLDVKVTIGDYPAKSINLGPVTVTISEAVEKISMDDLLNKWKQ